MSVISSPIRKPRRWLHLWPLALFLLFAVCGALWLWQAWPQVMMKSIIWQREVNQQMSGLLKAAWRLRWLLLCFRYYSFRRASYT